MCFTVEVRNLPDPEAAQYRRKEFFLNHFSLNRPITSQRHRSLQKQTWKELSCKLRWLKRKKKGHWELICPCSHMQPKKHQCTVRLRNRKEKKNNDTIFTSHQPKNNFFFCTRSLRSAFFWQDTVGAVLLLSPRHHQHRVPYSQTDLWSQSDSVCFLGGNMGIE